ncbi:MAG: lamin tail domain-containing protein [Candidatus Magasanikbacteria bacterium]
MNNGGNKFCKFFGFIIFIIVLNLVFVRQVFCYDSNIAHPGIADLAVKQYNQNNSQKISVEQLGWIKSGAIEEDTPTRWFNHFYDPIYNRGLWFGKQHDSAKVWAKDSSKQTEFAMGDNSWQRAINDYRKGNTELAFKELGHSIHLVSDMLVPAHTRDSIHAVPPDSYEQYVKKNWSTVSKNIKGEVVDKNSLEEIFDDVAKYSNGNFYSDNTIESNKYNINKIIKLDPYSFNNKVELFVAYTQNSDGSLTKSHLTGGTDWKNDKNTVNNSTILSDHASHLLPKAVGYSANTIKLFLTETQKNEKEKLPFFRVNLGGLFNTGVGKIISVAESVYDSALSQTPDDKISSGSNTSNQPSTNIPNESPITVPNPSTNQPVNASPVLSTPNPNPNNPIQNISPPSSGQYSGGGGGSSANPVIISPTVIEQTSVNTLTTTTSTSTTTSTDASSSTPNNTTSTTDFTTSTITDTITSTSTTQTTSTTDFTSSTVDIPPSPTSTTSTIDIPTSTPDTDTPTSTTTTTTPNTDTPTSTTTTSTPDPVPPAPDVVINEIAWAGTSATTDQDEYIELYNNTDQDILLFPSTNTLKWKIMFGDVQISIKTTINRVIPKNGYYLFERTDDRTVNEIAADIIYTGALNNTGERVRLLDGNGQLVDEVNASAGWFAGSASSYSSMEKINPRLSGNTSTNWQTNEGPRFEGKVDNGGDDVPLNGSPKQSNFGSIVLKSSQRENVRTLRKSDFPYILTYYEIPVSKTLNVDAGAVIKTYYAGSKIDVKGNLNINGSDTNKVIMTSGRDVNFSEEKYKTIFGTRTGSLQAKDWQGIMLYVSSTANLIGLDMRYAGKLFKAPLANMYDPLVSQAIRSNDATLNINNSIFNDNGDTTIYLSKSNSIIKNSNLKNGIFAIENYDGSLELENLNIDNYSNTNGPVYVKNIWPKMVQINLTNNITNNVVIDQVSFTSSTTINKDIPMTWQNITIEPNITVDVSAGTNIKLPEYSNLHVKGNLNLNGTENEPINIDPVQKLANYYWGRIIIDGGKANFVNANISGGRGSIWNDNYQGMVTVKNGNLDMQNCQLLDSRAPGNTLEITSSTVKINNSSIGYIGSKPNFANTNGIKIYSGELTLDNTNLMNLDTGILSASFNPLPSLYLNNMDIRNFMNVNLYWDPIIWFSGFATSTPALP